MTTEIINAAPDCIIACSRIINAPVDLVFKAWTDPDHHKNWWGPAGFTNTFNVYDLRPGGKWSFIMHGPDKKDYPNECVFIKIERPNLIAWNHLSKPEFQLVATFDEVATGKTKVGFKMIFDTPEACNKIKAFVGGKNEENLDKLEVELIRMSAG